MSLEILTCEFGKGHKWMRESTRGRKPHYCPKHKPQAAAQPKTGTPQLAPKKPAEVSGAPAPATAQRNLEKLTCEFDGHSWTRQSTRGRKPKYCPKHKQAIPAKAMIEVQTKIGFGLAPVGDTITLVCAFNDHEWERVRARGRKPNYCPEHSPKKVEPKTHSQVSAPRLPEPKTGPLTELEEYYQARDAAEAIRQQKERKAKERIDNLELMLKSSGLHLSQHREMIAV